MSQNQNEVEEIIKEIETNILKQDIPYKLSKLTNMPYPTYDDFLVDYRDKKVTIELKKYKSDIMEQFGTKADNKVHSIAFVGLLIVAIINIILAFIYKEFIFLWGVLAVILGMLSTSPSNPYGRKMSGLCGIAFILSFFYLTWEWRIIIGSMAISQILSMTARDQLKKVLIDRSLASEAIFCYLFRYKIIYIFKKH
ncbi:hypothetical protein [Sediminibacterium salmoneum]|uniref:hypothetical protein n=1 Tax=Sediminibacterium salmoneum TaxID=426421 RepID=UPI00047E9907|nr:hypothetical protein [Sediminibacterium salmoneum]